LYFKDYDATFSLRKIFFHFKLKDMKKIKWIAVILISFVLYFLPNISSATLPGVSVPVTSSSDAIKNLKASEFVKLSLKDISKLYGRKLSMKEKISFTIMNKKMKHAIKKDPNLTVKDYLATHRKLGTGWWILIVVIGIILIGFATYFANNN